MREIGTDWVLDVLTDVVGLGVLVVQGVVDVVTRRELEVVVAA